MTSILVVDDMAVIREPIAASLRLAGYKTLCAADGEEALRATRAHHPDLILLDVSMPKMDGITFLKHLRADPAISNIRVILLTALMEKDYVIAAASFGVKDYLLKSRFGLKELLERIKRPDAATSSAARSAPLKPAPETGPARVTAPTAAPDDKVPYLLTRDQFLQRVEHAFQAKTLSGVVAQVVATASSPRGDMAQLASLIGRDPMLSMRVLQASNSAAYASAGPAVTTIADAIRNVGCTTVRNIAAALGVFDCMPEAGADGFNPIRCWQHSFAVAQICERLASANLEDQSGLAYMVGLCHDLGDIFIRTEFSKEYQQVIETAARTGQPKGQLLGQMFGMTPAEMIIAVLQCMALPDAIREPIEIFNSAGAPRTAHPLARILWMAENYANAVMLASSPSSEVAPLTQSFCRAAVGGEKPSLPDPQTLHSQVLSLTVGLARLSRADEAKLLAPMFKKHTATIWLARDSSISTCDPVGLALESLSKVAIHQRLPTDGDAGEIDGLVVVAPSTGAAGFSQRDIETALVNRRAKRTLPALAVICDGARPGHQSGGISWRASVALSELAAFVEMLDKRNAA